MKHMMIIKHTFHGLLSHQATGIERIVIQMRHSQFMQKISAFN